MRYYGDLATGQHPLILSAAVAGLFRSILSEPVTEVNAKAVAAARLAMNGDGTHRISFDTVVETMRQTGLDMSSKYKETSEGGLAVNVVEC